MGMPLKVVPPVSYFQETGKLREFLDEKLLQRRQH
jgi:hypothetical protein